MRKIRKSIILLCMIFWLISLQTVCAEEPVGTGGTEAAGDAASYNGTGFDTPMECMEYFAERLADSDLEGALQAFALDDFIEKIDFEAYFENVGSWNMNSFCPLPARDELSIQLDKELYRGTLAKTIMGICIGFGSDIEMDQVQMVTDGEAFAREIGLRDLSTLSVLRMDYVLGQDSEAYQKAGEKLCTVYNCDAMEEYYILYGMKDQTFAGTVTMIQYNGRWFLYAMNSPVAGFTVYEIDEMSEADYIALITR